VVISKGQYDKRLEFNFKMSGNGINANHLKWCEENVEGEYGWWFSRTAPFYERPHKNDRAFVSFETKEDHAKFSWYMLKQNEN
tara:strand:- start:76 stop:324 length:249 start_codon:yes stop_codon:yes gene_type:complete